MKPTQYVLPANSIVDIAFQTDKENYNLHINTIGGIISLEHVRENKSHNLFHKIIPKQTENIDIT